MVLFVHQLITILFVMWVTVTHPQRSKQTPSKRWSNNWLKEKEMRGKIWKTDFWQIILKAGGYDWLFLSALVEMMLCRVQKGWEGLRLMRLMSRALLQKSRCRHDTKYVVSHTWTRESINHSSLFLINAWGKRQLETLKMMEFKRMSHLKVSLLLKPLLLMFIFQWFSFKKSLAACFQRAGGGQTSCSRRKQEDKHWSTTAR